MQFEVNKALSSDHTTEALEIFSSKIFNTQHFSAG